MVLPPHQNALVQEAEEERLGVVHAEEQEIRLRRVDRDARQLIQPGEQRLSLEFRFSSPLGDVVGVCLHLEAGRDLQRRHRQGEK